MTEPTYETWVNRRVRVIRDYAPGGDLVFQAGTEVTIAAYCPKRQRFRLCEVPRIWWRRELFELIEEPPVAQFHTHLVGSLAESLAKATCTLDLTQLVPNAIVSMPLQSTLSHDMPIPDGAPSCPYPIAKMRRGSSFAFPAADLPLVMSWLELTMGAPRLLGFALRDDEPGWLRIWRTI